MDKPKMLHQMDYDFDVWYKTQDPIFSDISIKSRIPDKWLSFKSVAEGKYKDSILKPINQYVEKLYQPPQLINILNNTIRLRQTNHAEFFLLEKENGSFINIDRPWMRQYYNTADNLTPSDYCFAGTFKFYVPWYIDANIEIFYEPVLDSPFYVYKNKSTHINTNNNIKYLEPDFVSFNFKREGSHMINNFFGKIKRESPMFDIVFSADDIIVNRIREFYEHN